MSSSKARETRVAVGSRSGPRSTIWKFKVQGNEVYIFTRMFGAEAKVSLHSSGECQWSCTGTWVTKVTGRRNADRHIAKWVSPRPVDAQALHVFRVQIPTSELRTVPSENDKKKVKWLSGFPEGGTVSLECYITPPVDSDPVLASNLPYQHLLSLPLADGRWFVVLIHVISLSESDLQAVREELGRQAKLAGIPHSEHLRGAVFFNESGTAKGLIELCLPEVQPFHRADGLRPPLMSNVISRLVDQLSTLASVRAIALGGSGGSEDSSRVRGCVSLCAL